MIQAAIFDMDGVIFDSQKVANELLRAMWQKVGVSVTKEDIDALQGVGHIELCQHIKDKYKLPESTKYYTDLYDENEEIRAYEKLDPNPGVIDLLHRIRNNGLKLALAISASQKRMEAVLKRYGIENMFDATVCRDDVTKSKPDPEIFNITAGKLGIKNENCVVFEDANNGVEAAKRAGMRCVGYINVNSGNQDLSRADVVISDFSTLDIQMIVGV